MTISVEEVKKVAFLSRLKIEDDKVAETEKEFNKILNWIGELDEVDTQGVEPLVSVNEDFITLRKDLVTDGQNPQEILENAPLKEYGYFAVPKVVE